MSKFSKILATSGLLVMSLSLVGCQNTPVAPEKAPEVVLQEGVSKLSDVTSYAYDLGLKGELNGPEGETPAKVSFDLDLSGGIDSKDPKDPKFNLNAKGNMMADADGGSGELAFRLNKDAVFLNLMNLDGKGSVTIPDEIKTQMIAKWWTMPIPQEALEQLANALPQGDVANLTDEQKQMKALVEQTNFFKNVKYVGMEDVKGEQSAHYTGELDKDAFMTFVEKAAELQNEPMDDQAKTQMKDGMEYFDFSGDMYVGQTNGVLNKVKGTINLKPNADKSSPTGKVSIELTISSLNKPVAVEVPEDAQQIPLDALSALPL